MISPNGFDNLLWYMGIVEDNIDPTHQGRVRVRCFGIHPPYESGEIATDELPWAVPINGTYSDTASVPKKAEWVFGFFIDGRDAQHPMILGTVPGQNLQLPTGTGSSDPYIKPSTEAVDDYAKPPLHPLKTLEDIETVPQLIIQDSGRVEGVQTPVTPPEGEEIDLAGTKLSDGWDEPTIPLGGDAHKTTIITSNYGDSYLQISGDGENEAFVISHSSGSHIQIDPAGNVKLKSFGDMYNVSDGHTREYSEGRRDVYINGRYTINARGDCILEVQGNLNHIVHGDYNLNVARRMSVSVGQGIEMLAQRMSFEAVTEHINIISAENIKMYAGDIFSAESVGKMYLTSGATIDVYGVQSVHTTSDSNVNMTAAGIITGDAPQIHWNSGLSTPATPTPEEPFPPQVDEPTNESIVSRAADSALGSVGFGLGGDEVDDFDGD